MAKAGVVVAVHKRHCVGGCATLVDLPPHFEELFGYVTAVRLKPPHGRGQEIVGTYRPPGSGEEHMRSLLTRFWQWRKEACLVTASPCTSPVT